MVTVRNTKGGTGKTTFAVQIALERQSAGKTVLLIDADWQGSAQKVMTMRAEGGHKPLACVQLADGRLLRAQLAPLAEQHDVTVIDAGGHDSEAFRFAMLRSDMLVVPVQPRAVDAWECWPRSRSLIRVTTATTSTLSRQSANCRSSPWPRPLFGGGRRWRTRWRTVSPSPRCPQPDRLARNGIALSTSNVFSVETS